MNTTEPEPTDQGAPQRSRTSAATANGPHIFGGVTGPEPAATRVDQVYDAIRSDLLTSRYGPGDWVKVSDLQKEFTTSLSVVREALSRLSAEQLLTYVPQRGFHVPDLSMDELQELTDARIKIEVLVLRDSLEFGGPQWQTALLRAHDVLAGTPLVLTEDTPRLNPQWVLVHAQFHDALLAGCPNRRLLSIATTLRDTAELHRTRTPAPLKTIRSVAEEHEKLVQLAVEPDIEACAELLAAHIGQTHSAIDRYNRRR